MFTDVGSAFFLIIGTIEIHPELQTVSGKSQLHKYH